MVDFPKICVMKYGQGPCSGAKKIGTASCISNRLFWQMYSIEEVVKVVSNKKHTSL
jgi:hypothetical protein